MSTSCGWWPEPRQSHAETPTLPKVQLAGRTPGLRGTERTFIKRLVTAWGATFPHALSARLVDDAEHPRSSPLLKGSKDFVDALDHYRGLPAIRRLRP